MRIFLSRAHVLSGCVSVCVCLSVCVCPSLSLPPSSLVLCLSLTLGLLCARSCAPTCHAIRTQLRGTVDRRVITFKMYTQTPVHTHTHHVGAESGLQIKDIEEGTGATQQVMSEHCRRELRYPSIFLRF